MRFLLFFFLIYFYVNMGGGEGREIEPKPNRIENGECTIGHEFLLILCDISYYLNWIKLNECVCCTKQYFI
jgi:hypothetical protein